MTFTLKKEWVEVDQWMYDRWFSLQNNPRSDIIPYFFVFFPCIFFFQNFYKWPGNFYNGYKLTLFVFQLQHSIVDIFLFTVMKRPYAVELIGYQTEAKQGLGSSPGLAAY